MKPQYTIATNRYGHYCIPLSSAHRPCAQTILAGDVHEPDTIQFILDHAGDGDVIHAGAYFGDMLPAFKGIKKMYAFEPNPENFLCAKITKELNGLSGPGRYREHDRISISIMSLGDRRVYRKGENIFLRMTLTEDALGGGSYVTDQYPKQSKDTYVQIQMIPIDWLFFYVMKDDPPVSIIHLDIEGSEQLALTGAMETITRCKPILILETLPDSEWIDANLTELGYKITGKVHSNSILECVK